MKHSMMSIIVIPILTNKKSIPMQTIAYQQNNYCQWIVQSLFMLMAVKKMYFHSHSVATRGLFKV